MSLSFHHIVLIIIFNGQTMELGFLKIPVLYVVGVLSSKTELLTIRIEKELSFGRLHDINWSV
jgi:hypothetical protein